MAYCHRMGDSGARKGIRTPDLMITNQLLYQLSYAGYSFVVNMINSKK